MWSRYKNNQNGAYFNVFPILAIDCEVAAPPYHKKLLAEFSNTVNETQGMCWGTG